MSFSIDSHRNPLPATGGQIYNSEANAIPSQHDIVLTTGQLSRPHHCFEKIDMLETTMTGHVGSMKYVAAPGKTPVLNINIACNRKVNEKEYTDWVSAKVWGERASKLKDYVGKGTHLLLKGRPESRGYKKSDGLPGAELVLHVTELEFLSAKSHGEGGGDAEQEETANLKLASV